MKLYSERTDNKEPLTQIVFSKFTDVCGGDPSELANILYSRYTVEDFNYADDSKFWAVVTYFNEVVVPHKIAVHKAGNKLLAYCDIMKKIGSSWRLYTHNIWIHDLSKFSANEAFGYAFYDRKTGSGKEFFETSWHHHKMNNPHHPEYWLNPNKGGVLDVVEMPFIYLLEMVADWIGAGEVYGNSLESWLPDNLHRFLLHENSYVNLQFILKQLGMETRIEDGKMYMK